jgi:hypothetical protein
MWWKYDVLMYENGKMGPVEIFPGSWRGRMEEVSSTLIYCKNFCKCHNVPLIQQ